MRKEIAALVLALVLVWSASACASAITGELQAGGVHELEGEITSVPLQASVAFTDDLQGKGKLYLELKGKADAVEDSFTLSLGEAYGTFYLGDVDLTVGRKAVSWGTVDAFGPTNYFARLSEDALLQGSMKGEPVNGVQAAYYGPNWSVTGVVVPWFSPQKISPLMRQAFLAQPGGDMVLAVIENAEVPELAFENMEWAARFETSLQGWDIQLSTYSGFEPLPGLKLVLVLPLGFVPQAEYRRQTYFGAAAAGFVGDVGIKAEVAYGGPEPFAEGEEGQMVIPLSQNENAWKAAVGVEYTVPVGMGLLIQGQYIYAGSGSLFSPYLLSSSDSADEPDPAHYLMGRVSYNFTLENSVELTALYSHKDSSVLVLPGFTYRLPQGIELKGSLLKKFTSEEQFSEFEFIPDQVRFGVTYRF